MGNILVIGDSCTDIFIYGDIDRVSPEAPVPVFKPQHRTENGGMSKNVMKNLESLGCTVEIVTNENDIKKMRYVHKDSNQMVLRVDEHDYCRKIDDTELKYIKDWGDSFEAVIISDYCKGFLSEEDIKFICANCENVFIDTKKLLGEWALGAKFIKINGVEHQKNYEIIPNYPEFKEKLIVTKGKMGCIYKDTIFSVEEVPVKDVSGAGDTFLAGLVSEYIKSNDIEKSIKFAQECTTKVVQKHGVSTI
tara:strand:- start:299 stop:1045 length:747 start_codon:yes stop_codon:yes gene_type:complete